MTRLLSAAEEMGGQAEWREPADVPGVASPLQFFFNLLLERGFTRPDIEAGMLPSIYLSEDELPEGDMGRDQFAVISAPGPIPGLVQLAWSQTGEDTWTPTNWPYVRPPSPLGTWVVNADDNTIGAGNNAWQYWMGAEYHITAAAAGLAIKRLAFKGGTNAGTTHNWEIRKSTVQSPTAPSLATYTTVVDSGTVTFAADNTWEEVTLPAEVPVAPDEWYVIWYWIGVGGQSQSIGTLSPTQLSTDYADTLAGVYRFASGSLPGPASSVPQTRQTSVLYGLATLGIG